MNSVKNSWIYFIIPMTHTLITILSLKYMDQLKLDFTTCRFMLFVTFALWSTGALWTLKDTRRSQWYNSLNDQEKVNYNQQLPATTVSFFFLYQCATILTYLHLSFFTITPMFFLLMIFVFGKLPGNEEESE